MKKVLFIYYMFPPLLGGWRAIASFVRYLPEFGWQPIILSASESVSYGKDYSLLREVPDDVEVHRVGHREPSRVWKYAINKLKMNMDFPDYYKYWYYPAIQEGRKILRDQKIDVIFSYAPPYTCHFVAISLKKEFDIPLVTDSEDPWSGNKFLHEIYDKTLIKPLRMMQRFRIKKEERHILNSSDRNIVVSWHHRQQLCELHSLEEKSIIIMNNGYDEFDFKGLKPHTLYPDRLNITFLGTFYPQFIDPIQIFQKVVDEVTKDVEVALIGRGTDALNGMSLTRIMYVPKEKALAFCSGSDFLLLIMPPDAKWIPMKIYDYLRLSKPILALVPEDGDAARIVRDAKAGFILSFEPERMRQQIKVIFDRWRKGEFKSFQPDGEYIEQFERRKLTERIVKVFNEISS